MARARAAYVAPMTSTAAPARSIDETLAELVEEFDLLGDWEGRIEYVALLLRLYSGRLPAEILDFDARAALGRLGLPSALTRQRANGLNSMVGRIREAALAAG